MKKTTRGWGFLKIGGEYGERDLVFVNPVWIEVTVKISRKKPARSRANIVFKET